MPYINTLQRAALMDWLRAHPLAWSSWPTFSEPIDDVPAARPRERRLVQHGCPFPISSDLVRVVDEHVAQLRHEHRVQYRKACQEVFG